MTDLVTYELEDGIATIKMDDGKANVMNTAMSAELSQAFTQAASDEAVTILTGRGRIFSGGYDMAVFEQPIEEIYATLQAGGELVAQILDHPLPVVGACNGHAVAQGAFVLMSCDVRLGTAGDFKIGLNEVAIGLTIPHYGVEVARHQLDPAWFDKATITGELFHPVKAQTAGFLHEVVDAEKLQMMAQDRAEQLQNLNMEAHTGTKKRARRHVLEAIRESLTHEFVIEN